MAKTLPAANDVPQGTLRTIRNESGTAFVVTADGGSTINGQANFTIDPNNAAGFVSNGTTDWKATRQYIDQIFGGVFIFRRDFPTVTPPEALSDLGANANANLPITSRVNGVFYPTAITPAVGPFIFTPPRSITWSRANGPGWALGSSDVVTVDYYEEDPTVAATHLRDQLVVTPPDTLSSLSQDGNANAPLTVYLNGQMYPVVVSPAVGVFVFTPPRAMAFSVPQAGFQLAANDQVFVDYFPALP